MTLNVSIPGICKKTTSFTFMRECPHMQMIFSFIQKVFNDFHHSRKNYIIHVIINFLLQIRNCQRIWIHKQITLLSDIVWHLISEESCCTVRPLRSEISKMFDQLPETGYRCNELATSSLTAMSCSKFLIDYLESSHT